MDPKEVNPRYDRDGIAAKFASNIIVRANRGHILQCHISSTSPIPSDDLRSRRALKCENARCDPNIPNRIPL